MKIKEDKARSSALHLYKSFKSRAARSAWFSSLGVISYTLVIFSFGLFIAQSRIFAPYATPETAARILNSISNRFSGLFADADHLFLDIKHADFQKLAYKRDVAFKMGRLTTSEDDYVPATLRRNDETYNVKIRLKGDWLDHLEGDKWSYRIKIKDDAALDGLRIFSVQHPKTRNFLAEWVYHQALKNDGILSLRYEFVQLTVNGKYLGIFAMEEHFNKILVEHNHRREGPIIRMSEEVVWEQLEDLETFPQTVPYSSSSFRSVHLDAFESSSVAADSAYHQMFLKAISLLEGFRGGTLQAHEAFDVDKLASYLAISELMGAQHSVIWNNMRFYFNPVTARLEPIGFDGKAGTPLEVVAATMAPDNLAETRMHLVYQALEDPVFKNAYLSALHRVADPVYLDNLLQTLQPGIKSRLNILYKEFPDYVFPVSIFEQNRQLIHFLLNPEDAARFHLKRHSSDSLFIDAGATQSLPIQPVFLHFNDSLTLPFEPNRWAPGRIENQVIVFSERAIEIPQEFVKTDSSLSLLRISYKILGQDSLQTSAVFPYPHATSEFLVDDVSMQAENAGYFPFLMRDSLKKSVRSLPGSWKIDQNLVLPAGYAFEVPAGTQLDLVNGSLILARGHVELAGTSTHPVQIVSSDSSGQGLVVLQADSTSHLSHARFQHLSAPNQAGWTLTGSVTFYESPVFFKHVAFDRANAEDALNIIRTSFVMDSVVFTNTYSDAFDGDFVEGQILNTRFERAGNDGIDVSGSKLYFNNVTVDHAGDKAFSAGESSDVTGEGLKIYNSEIGIASKDLSVIIASDVLISNSRLGTAIFQKKPEFGPATVQGSNYVLENVEVPALVETGSSFHLNGELKSGDKKQVADLLYGNLYGTASR